MTATPSSMERLVTLLGGWPDHFEDAQKKHGESLLELLRRERLLDEAVFGQVVRYATHRAAYDRLSAEIAAEDLKAPDEKAVATSDKHYLSGKEQSRAFHENKLLVLERELLATPYARGKNGMKIQTSFMDLLTAQPEEKSGPSTVTPFKPLAKKKRGK